MAKAAQKESQKNDNQAQLDIAPIGDNMPEMNKDELMHFYREMLMIRRFEEKAGQLYGMGLIGGFCHLYIGQEAVAVGMKAVIEEGDAAVTGYRDHAHCLSYGMSMEEIMSELTGRAAGCSQGKGGSMHMFNTEQNFYGGHGIVGAQVSIGAGLAFAQKYRESDRVTLTYFGDGASNQGQVYESFNMAALWKLPVIFVIENNQYGMGTSVERAASGSGLWKRGEGFNIPGKRIDGMNVLEVREATREAVKHCREGNGPYIIEAMTYRYRGHSMSDPAKYRSKDEVSDFKDNKDPINLVKKWILEHDFASEDELKALDKEIKGKVNEAAEFAKTAPEPDESELYTNVYVGE